ncbi:hypothetical protein [Candidatus Nitrosocosmicus franklandus]|uniref:Uncharacterized protein n=1 Tax=Candidatus Nitrosocosmicus franklandianus TaxID=1798806 RepID=A0A484ID61_9ARCH|nr:hypothetical protein [Candidatus Nitrosocosmicus franklandus]VFJ14746.1 conserved protein of unknown function [Candidatus Nitrosocosmicus franklandus]
MDIEFTPKMLAVFFIIAGIIVVFMLMGGSLTQLFSASIQEVVSIQIKQDNTCIVEASDGVPRSIDNCPYQLGDNVTINYKQGIPTIESHRQ